MTGVRGRTLAGEGTSSGPTPTGPSVAWVVPAIAALAVFYPVVIDGFFSQFIALPALLAGLFVVEFLRSAGRLTPVKMVLLWAAFGVLLVLLNSVFSDPERVSSRGTYLMGLELVFATGAGFVVSDKRLATFARAYLVTAVVTVGPAFVEWHQHRRLFALGAEVNPDFSRAEVGQQHPIILGVAFVVAVVIASQVRPTVIRLATVAFLLAGIYFTGSQGPLAVGIVFAAPAVLPPLRRWCTSHTRFLVLGAWVLAVVAVYLAIEVWTPVVRGTTVQSYNSGYRPAIYSLVPDMIRARPFGFGPGGLPKGEFFIDSYLYGRKDVAETIDAEPVFLAGQFGLIGLAFYGWCVMAGIRTLRSSFVLGAAMVALMAGGTTVALHAWPSVGAIWGFLLGGMLSARRRSGPPTASDPSSRARLRPDDVRVGGHDVVAEARS